MLKGFHHVSLTCGSLEKSVAFYRDLLGLTEVRRVTSASGGEVVVLDADGAALELFPAEEPMSPPPAIDVRHVPGVRHIALSVDSVEAEYRRLSAAGVKFTVLPREGRVFPNVAKLAFCEGPDGVLVELMEERSQP